jgi:hypothetical protein
MKALSKNVLLAACFGAAVLSVQEAAAYWYGSAIGYRYYPSGAQGPYVRYPWMLGGWGYPGWGYPGWAYPAGVYAPAATTYELVPLEVTPLVPAVPTLQLR